MKKLKSVSAKLLVLSMALMLFVSMTDNNETKAASTKEKVVYTVKQLKKAMKASAAANILFRTETNDDITIPAVKAAKNKNVTIYAPNSVVTNKAKFKTVSVRDTKGYFENANNNTIYTYEYNMETLTVMPGKAVKKLVFMNYEYGKPDIVIRKGAKVSSLVFDSFGTKSKKDSKSGAVSIATKNQYIPGNPTTTTIFELDKSGRITSLDVNDSYAGGGEVSTFKYDSNGNLVKEEYTASGDLTITSYKYDKNNNKTEIKAVDREGNVQYTYVYEYDSNNRMVKSYTLDSMGNKNFFYTWKYDKKGRLIEEANDYTDTVSKYTYDSAGRMITAKTVNRYDNSVTNDYTYKYNSKGLLSETIYNKSQGGTSAEYNAYDKTGERIYTAMADNDGLLNNIVFKYAAPGSYKYEDGFASPVISEAFDSSKKTYKKNGYTIVTSVKELLDSIKPGAKIILKPGTYNLSDEIEKIWKNEGSKFNSSHKYLEIEEVFDGVQLFIKNVDGLTISGGSNYASNTSIISEPRYSNVLGFKNCKKVTLNSLTIGHTESSECEGDVIRLENCKDTKLYNMDLYGCGVYGIYTSGATENLTVYNSRLHDCSNGPVCIYDECKGKFSFVCCSFDSSRGGGVCTNYSKDFSLILDRCAMGENETNIWYFMSDYNKSVTYKNCFWSEVTQYPDYGY